MNAIDEKILLGLKKKIAFETGQRIKNLRKQKKLSQTDLAIMVGMDRQYLYKIESAKVTPNIGTITSIAFALNVSLSELFYEINF
ncbi:helix-turn-helix domain-containing protein [Flavobacterium sp.]|uniref:helix-turn-helix domain-containing protein n=1 Tax=Flavobacterium sp. TaxID=239 RepID=UPI003F69E291